MTNIETQKGTWSELLGPAYVRTSLILAGGVGLHAVNIFLTTSLLPSAVDEIAGERLYAWSTTMFMIASVISSTLVSRLLARRGPVGSYVAAFVAFVVGTLVCALSPTMEVMLAGRAVQGFGGGLLAGLGYAMIQSSLPERLWVKATALISAMWGVGTLLGPVVGGVFAQFGAWRLAFVLLAAIAVAIALLTPVALPHKSDLTSAIPVPWASLALLTGATAGVSVASLMADEAVMVFALALSAVLFGGFIARERTAAVPILPSSTYSASSPLKWVYLSIGVLAVGTVSEAFTPLFGQRLGNLEPLLAGFLGAAVSVGWSTAMFFSANASTPGTIRRLRVLGPLVLAVGLATTGLLQQENAGTVAIASWFVGLVTAGIGIGLAFPHLVAAAMASSQDDDEAGKAGAGANTVELMAMAMGSALGGLLVNLGAPSMLASSRYLFFGLAVVGLLGFFSALKIGRLEVSSTSDAVVEWPRNPATPPAVTRASEPIDPSESDR